MKLNFSMRRAQGGFTLIELMVVAAIVGILAAVALPSYRDSVMRAKRGDAKAVLGQMQTWMERYYTENGRYDRNQFGQNLNVAALAYPSAPAGAAVPRYTVTLENLGPNAYTLVATPVNEMAGDDCGSYTLTSQGVRAVRGSTYSAAEQATMCWGR
jgi:type IV pilus assembly protein PilE